MAKFEDVRYQGDRDNGDVFRLTVREGVDRLEFDSGIRNFAPNQAIRYQWHAIAADNAQGYGLHCRGVFVKWIGQAPDGYEQNGRLFVPILRRTNFWRVNVTDEGTWLGSRVVVVGRRQEKEV